MDSFPFGSEFFFKKQATSSSLGKNPLSILGGMCYGVESSVLSFSLGQSTLLTGPIYPSSEYMFLST